MCFVEYGTTCRNKDLVFPNDCGVINTECWRYLINFELELCCSDTKLLRFWLAGRGQALLLRFFFSMFINLFPF